MSVLRLLGKFTADRQELYVKSKARRRRQKKKKDTDPSTQHDDAGEDDGDHGSAEDDGPQHSERLFSFSKYQRVLHSTFSDNLEILSERLYRSLQEFLGVLRRLTASAN